MQEQFDLFQMEQTKSMERQHGSIKSASCHVLSASGIHSKQLHQLAKKAASTCVGGVLPSNAFFDAYDKLRKPFKIDAPPPTSSEFESTSCFGKETSDNVVEASGNHAKDDQNDQQEAISSISHLLDIDKFDMLEKPKTEKKWGKLSKAVKEKTVAVAAVQTKSPVETVDVTDLLLFYYSKHRNSIWLALSHS